MRYTFISELVIVSASLSNKGAHILDIFDKCFDKESGYFASFRNQDDKYFFKPKLVGKPGPRMSYNDKEVIVWSINSYLGLHQHPDFIQTAQKSVSDFGSESPMGSRLMSGDCNAHTQLEQDLASFLDKERGLLFSSGYLGVIGTICALVGSNDVVVTDSQNHACIIDAIRLSTGPQNIRVYKHHDPEDLEEVLKSVRRKHSGGLLIITEGLFGMTGELAKLSEICSLKEKYNARLMIDDAHGVGTVGPQGQGTASYYQVQDKVDIIFGTFAKAFAGIGGFMVSDESITKYVQFNARTNIFTKALPLLYVNTALAALNTIKNDSQRLQSKLHNNANKLKESLTALGCNIGNCNAQIVPVYLSCSIEKGAEIIKSLREKFNIFVSGVCYPVVPKGVFLIRLIPTALHNDEDIKLTINAFSEISKIYKELRN